MTQKAVREHFIKHALIAKEAGSPFTALACYVAGHRLSRAEPVGRRVLDWPGDPKADALAQRFASALHALVLQGDALAAVYPPKRPKPDEFWPEVVDVLAREPDQILSWLNLRPRTNDPACAAVLAPGLGEVARRTGLPVALFEIGAGAGVTVHLDRFFYEVGGWSWGDAASKVRLSPMIHGAPPPEPSALRIAHRAACDLNPLDPSDPKTALRLRAYCGPDQPQRLQRLEAALQIAARSRLRVVRADAGPWALMELSRRKQGVVGVLAHSMVWGRLSDISKSFIEAFMTAQGALATPARPLAWLRLEDFGAQGAAVLRLTLWPGGETEDLALADAGGAWIAWGALS